MASPLEGLARLRAAAESDGLDTLCLRHGIEVMTVFGSAARGAAAARDLDIGVIVARGVHTDYPRLIGDLVDLTATNLDLVVLNHGSPLLRERALVGAVALFESDPGAWSRASTAAALERMDTAWMRRLSLELLAGR